MAMFDISALIEHFFLPFFLIMGVISGIISLLPRDWMIKVVRALQWVTRLSPAPKNPESPEQIFRLWQRVLFRFRLRRESLRVGFHRYPPLVESDDAATVFEGLFPLFVDNVEKALRITVERKGKRISVLHKEDEAKDIEMMAAVFQTPRRDHSWRFTAPIYAIGLRGVVRRGEGGTHTLEELFAGRPRVSVNEGEAGWEFMTGALGKQYQIDNPKLDVHNGIAIRDVGNGLLARSTDLAIIDELSCELCVQQFLDSHGQPLVEMAFPRVIDVYGVSFAVKPHLAWMRAYLQKVIDFTLNDPNFKAQEATVFARYGKVILRVR